MRSVSELTSQEAKVLLLVAQGWRTAKIASALCISPRTVESHIYHIFDKLSVSSRMEAALYALHNGLLPTAKISRSSDDNADERLYAESIR
jgi:DNA-binding NarL/FixJ family response regulator